MGGGFPAGGADVRADRWQVACLEGAEACDRACAAQGERADGGVPPAVTGSHQADQEGLQAPDKGLGIMYWRKGFLNGIIGKDQGAF